MTSVEINGELPPGTNGFSTVEIRWKHGLLHYVTYVRQAHVREDVESEPGDDDVSATVTTAPSARLLSSQSGLHLSGGGNASYSGSRILGFEAPGWLWLTSAVLMAATVVLLVKGPPLWRATRWAWFWLLASPIGMAAFLLLSGPFPGLPKPRSANRLTGGWAFLRAIVVKALSISLWGITRSS